MNTVGKYSQNIITFHYSSVISQKDDSRNGCYKKTKHTKFPEKRTLLTHCYADLLMRVMGWEMFVFQKTWSALFSCNTSFYIHPFALLPTNYWSHNWKEIETLKRDVSNVTDLIKLHSLICWNYNELDFTVSVYMEFPLMIHVHYVKICKKKKQQPINKTILQLPNVGRKHQLHKYSKNISCPVTYYPCIIAEILNSLQETNFFLIIIS